MNSKWQVTTTTEAKTAAMAAAVQANIDRRYLTFTHQWANSPHDITNLMDHPLVVWLQKELY